MWAGHNTEASRKCLRSVECVCVDSSFTFFSVLFLFCSCFVFIRLVWGVRINLLKPNDIYIRRTAALTSRRYILYIYSTNIHTENFKHAA